MVVPLTIQEARTTSLPLPPNIPDDDPRSPPFASNTNVCYSIMSGRSIMSEVN